jgi:23S rRNA pseudouridine2605 synthase
VRSRPESEKKERELPEAEVYIPVRTRAQKPEIRLSGEESVSRLKSSLKGSTPIGATPIIQNGIPWRINRYLASCGYGSRRQVEDYVLAGRVEVNGKKVTGLDVRIAAGDVVCVDGKVVSPNESSLYYALNKPEGYVVSNRRFPGEDNIYDLLPENLQNLKYAGRLDKNSRGLVILSTDGQFIAAVTHPRRRLTKRYLVTVDRLIPEGELQTLFYKGIESEGELLRAIRVAIADRERRVVEVVLGEGKKRQIRRMFKSLNIEVLDLFRIAVGFLDLTKKGIQEGKYAPFTPSELLYGKEGKQPKDLPASFNPWGR